MRQPFGQRVREVRRLIDEVVDARWSHPAWWALVAGVAWLEGQAKAGGPGADEGLFLRANGWPHADTFMARPVAPATDRAEAVARAVVRGRIAADVLAELDGAFPGQPLRQTLVWRRGWLDSEPLPESNRRAVAFVGPAGTVRAELTASSESTTARSLADFLATGRAGDGLEPVDRHGRTPLRTIAAVDLLPGPLAAARHAHRRSWTAGGGPWLGIADATEGLALVTTCHAAVDGYAHAVIASRVLAGDERARADIDSLAAELRQSPANRKPLPEPERDAPATTGFATRVLAEPSAFPRQAYAFGRALERLFGPGAERGRVADRRFSPSFQVPIAPGTSADPDRRRRRVLSALLSLRRDGDEPEPWSAFAARLPPWLERERAGRGLLARLTHGVAGSSLPPGLKRTLLRARRRPSAWLPTVAALGGRGRLSSLRFADGDRPSAPLFAASMPALGAYRHDPRGSFTLTLIQHEGGWSATVFGTGRAGGTGAAACLDAWLEELDRARSSSRGD